MFEVVRPYQTLFRKNTGRLVLKKTVLLRGRVR